jgi:hypothetical protein
MLSRSRTVLHVVGGLSASICFPDSRTPALQTNETKETLFIKLFLSRAAMQRLWPRTQIIEGELQGQTSQARLSGGALRYSPECVEEEFCELRLYGVLRSSA